MLHVDKKNRPENEVIVSASLYTGSKELDPQKKKKKDWGSEKNNEIKAQRVRVSHWDSIKTKFEALSFS